MSPKPSFLKRVFASPSSAVDSTALFHLEKLGYDRTEATTALRTAGKQASNIDYVISLLDHNEHIARRKDLAQVVKVGDKIPVGDMWEPSCSHCATEQSQYAKREADKLAKMEKAGQPSKITRFSSDEEIAAHYLQVSNDYATKAKIARKSGMGGAGDEQLAKHYLGLAREHAEKARVESKRRGIGMPRDMATGVSAQEREMREMAEWNTKVLLGRQGAPLEAGVRQREFLY